MATDEEAEPYAAIAIELTTRIRDEQPHDVWRWLRHTAPTYPDMMRLALILAAAIPIDRNWNRLTQWADPDINWRQRDIERAKKARWRAKQRDEGAA